jgi:hypothetical protein
VNRCRRRGRDGNFSAIVAFRSRRRPGRKTRGAAASSRRGNSPDPQNRWQKSTLSEPSNTAGAIDVLSIGASPARWRRMDRRPGGFAGRDGAIYPARVGVELWSRLGKHLLPKLEHDRA